MTEETSGAIPPSGADDQPVSVFTHLRPRTGREDDCLQWIRGIAGASQQFPGHLGSNILQPADKHGGEFVVIYRFDRVDNLRRWEESEERKQWHERSNGLFENELKVQKLIGLEHWFTLPGEPRPARYKMAIMTFLIIYPLAMSANLFLHPLLGSWPGWLRELVIMPVMVTLMVFVILPTMTKLLAPWLFSSSRKTEQALEPIQRKEN